MSEVFEFFRLVSKLRFGLKIENSKGVTDRMCPLLPLRDANFSFLDWIRENAVRDGTPVCRSETVVCEA